jgi:Tfp pilus assembly PilM family ATPase
MMLKQLVNRFTTSPLVGVDLGSAALKVIEVEQADGRVILRRCAVAAVERHDPVTLLKRLLSEASITTTHAALGLASPEVIVKPFQFPSMPKKELVSAIHLEAEEAVLNGHPSNDMAIDWQTFSSRSKESVRGLLAVVPRTVITTRLQTVKAAGLHPTVVDVEGLALWNAYWALVGSQEPTPKTVLLVNIGAQITNLVIAKGPDELMLVRDVQLGAKALAEGQGKDWAAEVRDSLGYARSKGGLRSLETIYVTGGGGGPNVIPLLKSAAAAPLTFWNPLNEVVCDSQSPSVENSVGPLLAIAIGLALRQPS